MSRRSEYALVEINVVGRKKNLWNSGRHISLWWGSVVVLWCGLMFSIFFCFQLWRCFSPTGRTGLTLLDGLDHVVERDDYKLFREIYETGKGDNGISVCSPS